MANINETLMDKVNEIFLEEQKKRGITSGDVEPMTAYLLDQKTEELAKMIAAVLDWQEVFCK